MLAGAAFTWFGVLLCASDWYPATCFLMPAFVIGCRHFEIARYETVHRSRWLLVLIGWNLAMVPLTLPMEGVLPQWLAIVFAAMLVVAGGHLFVVQRRLLKERIARGVQDRSQPCADWACGGLLAALPPTCLAGFGDVLAVRDPWAWLPSILGVALLVLQLRRNRLFPWLGMACLVAWAGETAIAWLSASHGTPAWVVAWNLVATCASTLVLAAYLGLSPRVRRTFVATAA